MARIKIELTVDVDLDEWSETYGLDRSESRQDVKEYVRHLILQSNDLIQPAKPGASG